MIATFIAFAMPEIVLFMSTAPITILFFVTSLIYEGIWVFKLFSCSKSVIITPACLEEFNGYSTSKEICTWFACCYVLVCVFWDVVPQ